MADHRIIQETIQELNSPKESDRAQTITSSQFEQEPDEVTEHQRQQTFLNSFSLAASKKQLGLNVSEVADFEPEKVVQQELKQMPGFVSEPNFEDDISIEVEPEDDQQVQSERAEPEDDSDELHDLK